MNSAPRWDFSGRAAIVTGAARGIGLAVVQQLAANGASVVGWDIPGADWTEAAKAGGTNWLAVDRKSTRLNSSHVD